MNSKAGRRGSAFFIDIEDESIRNYEYVYPNGCFGTKVTFPVEKHILYVGN
jgi:hypothetical protein